MVVGKLGRIDQGYQPIYHLIPMLYASVAFALRENNKFLILTSSAYRKLIEKAKRKARREEDNREINFAVGQAVKKAPSCKRKYRIVLSMREEIQFLRKILTDDTVTLATSLGHIVPRNHKWEQAADSCKRSRGG